MQKMLKTLCALMKSDTYRKMELKRMKDQSMFEQANQDAFIHKATPIIIAAALTSLHELNVRRASTRSTHSSEAVERGGTSLRISKKVKNVSRTKPCPCIPKQTKW